MSGRSPPPSPAARRFGMYFLGVAIGCVLVGLMLTARRLTTSGPAPEQAGGPAPASTP